VTVIVRVQKQQSVQQRRDAFAPGLQDAFPVELAGDVGSRVVGVEPELRHQGALDRVQDEGNEPAALVRDLEVTQRDRLLLSALPNPLQGLPPVPRSQELRKRLGRRQEGGR